MENMNLSDATVPSEHKRHNVGAACEVEKICSACNVQAVESFNGRAPSDILTAIR